MKCQECVSDSVSHLPRGELPGRYCYASLYYEGGPQDEISQSLSREEFGIGKLLLAQPDPDPEPELEPTEVEKEEERLNYGRLREAPLMKAGARRDRHTALRSLGLVTRDGERRPFRGHFCRLVLSQEYEVDGWDSQRGLMRINSRYTLSLRPEVVGAFMGIDFTGPVPEQRAAQDRFRELERYIVGQPRSSRKVPARAPPLSKGLAADCLEPRLRDYIRMRRPGLGFTNNDRQLAHTQVFAFKEELYSNKRFDWVSTRIIRIENVLDQGTGRRCRLSESLREFLLRYVEEAMDYFFEVRGGAEMVHAGQVPGLGLEQGVGSVVTGRREEEMQQQQRGYGSGRREEEMQQQRGYGSGRREEEMQQQRGYGSGPSPGAGTRKRARGPDSVVGREVGEAWERGNKVPKIEVAEEEFVHVPVQVQQPLNESNSVLVTGKREEEEACELLKRVESLERNVEVEKARWADILSRISALEQQRDPEEEEEEEEEDGGKWEREELMVADLQEDLSLRDQGVVRNSTRLGKFMDAMKTMVSPALFFGTWNGRKTCL